MNASASASSLNWWPTIRRRAAAGRSCGAAQRVAPSTPFALVADLTPPPPQAPRLRFLSILSETRSSEIERYQPGQNRSGSVKPSQACHAAKLPRPETRNPRPQKRVKPSQAQSRWAQLPAPRTPDPRPQTQDPRPQTPDPCRSRPEPS